MNAFDRAIAAVSPRWAYKRAAWRRGMAVFDSGSVDRLSINWNPQSGWNEQRLRIERERIRARAQDMERNSDIGKAVLAAFQRGVIGEGLALQSKAEDSMAEMITKQWKEWTQAENCDVTAAQDFTEMLETILTRRIVDGGIFIYKAVTDDKRFPFKLQLRTVDELDTTLTVTNIEPANGNEIVDGVEIDSYGRHVAYHFKKYKGTLQVQGESVRIPAKDVIFWHHKSDPRQVREISELATSLNRVKDTNEFLEAVNIKERVLACLSVFIKKALPTGQAGRMNNMIKPVEGRYDGMSLEPGMIGELNPGDEVQTVIPSGQASNTAQHVTTMLRLIGASVGLSYEAISRDLSNVTYSSARQGVVEDRKTYKRYIRSLVNRVLTPIFYEFVATQILVGALPVPPKADIVALAKHTWIPSGSAWIDPTREVAANKVALETSQTTLARICAENGEDWREVIEQRAAERLLEKKLMGGAEVAGKSNSGGAA
ncbi:phage portal protein [Paenibacillus thiaminolyticus]|uniref:phage portal protein n=1 Tax=Paenibacillus thiaminolyticus TaxID=49283 RepID=UPI002542B0F7|nr:phage portal protein [Paenibacillus thiaminolyticus]WII39690.1 phage portal protein [Paenibacillus thiaminolyticus]